MRMKWQRAIKKAKRERRIAQAVARGRIWSSSERTVIKRALLRRDGDRCWLCGSRLNMTERNSPEFWSIDHVQPLSLGGSNNRRNLKLAHQQCNHQRGNTKKTYAH